MNFDEERAKRKALPNTFTLAGETFTFKRGLRPETFEEYVKEYAEMGSDDPKSLEIVDRTITNFLDGDAEAERWKDVRAQEDDAITAGDMRKVLIWLIEEQADNRPTEASSLSGNGDAPTGTRSTESSSSRPVVLAGSGS